MGKKTPLSYQSLALGEETIILDVHSLTHIFILFPEHGERMIATASSASAHNTTVIVSYTLPDRQSL